MACEKTVVCFANSRKRGGKCFAGKEWLDGAPGAWIRPVGDRPWRELEPREMRLDDESEPDHLDVVRIPLAGALPAPHQRENHSIVPRGTWTRVDSLAWEEVPRWIDSPDTLWKNGHSSRGCMNNCLPVGAETGVSLHLIRPERFVVEARSGDLAAGHRPIRGEFVYHGTRHVASVTDPHVEATLFDYPDGRYPIDDAYLCMSLSEEFQGHYYKLIAAVLYPKRFGR